ncbi:MAG: hypothetical protein IT375_11995, partial [Polyangiaceae bacterium]|nr:hypothetical protein [Polyangiaceae bacterium]
MRRVALASAVGGVSLFSVLSGCGPAPCEDSDSCGAYSGGAAGAGGAGGTSGNGGTSGTGGTGGTSGTGGASGSGGAGGDAGTCDATKSPAEEACLVSDQYAVFVNGLAPTTGTGTKASPYKTISEAIKAAGSKLIVVCDTTYDEQLTLTSGVKLFGGFACSDWSYETGKRASVKPKKGVALDISGATATVLIEDMEFASADASAAGESSVAATIATSSDVKLRRVKLVAGKGQAGANGALAAYTYPAQSTLNGKSASGLTGGGVAQCACPAGDQSIGGGGGNAPTPQDGNPGLPSLGGGQGGKATAVCAGPGSGSNGAPATPPAPAPGASTLGTLTNTTWSPTKAPNASPGGPGQGGGGGASSASGGGGGG